jgi:hypothetical protein
MAREIATKSVPAAVLDPAEAEYSRLASLDTEALRSELAAAISLTADSLRRLAMIVRLLEERGEDLTDLRIGLIGYLRRIAHGQLVPEAVVRFGESPGLLRAVAALPLPEQRRLAAGATVTVVVPAADGFTNRQADPLALPAGGFRQVFGPRGIRGEAEQILYLGERHRFVKAAEAVKVGRVVADRKRGGLMIGRTYVPAASVIEALAALRAAPDESPEGDESEDLSCQTNIKLTPDEQHRLKQAALDGRISVHRLLRRALVAAGLI